jgi:type IV pilus assembly protein PilO
MKFPFKSQRYITLSVITIVVTADIALFAFSIQMSAAKSPQRQLAEQRAHLKILKADVKRARDIQSDIPKIKADCDRFETSLVQSSQGYSAISAELTDQAKHAGVLLDSVGFKPKPLARRGITEVEVDATITGEYRSVVRFLNGLQRSDNYYVLQSLSLASGQNSHGPVGSLRVALHMKSYFRNAA